MKELSSYAFGVAKCAARMHAASLFELAGDVMTAEVACEF